MDVSQIPTKYRGLHERAMSGKSRKAAIRAHCLMCVGWQAREVELCTAKGCPLYPYRLISEARKTPQKGETETIRPEVDSEAIA